ncbi:MAG TPA: LysR family transcriptional regulator, partial [Labilithrix sp.]|nr:LysR family transcriptional regulator [Labilithrix sp.]
VPLFERRGKKVTLTPRGRVLRDRAARVLEEVHALRADLTQNDVEARHLTLAASHGLAGRVLVPSWAGVSRKHQTTTADIFSMRSSEVVAQVVGGTIDVGVCFSPLPHPEMVVEPLASGQLRIACKRGHPLLRARRASVVEQLRRTPAVMPKAFAGIDVCEHHPALEALDLLVTPIVRYDSYETAATLLDELGAWTLLPDLVAAWSRPNLALTQSPSGWDAPYTIAAVHRRAQKRTPVVDALLRAVTVELASFVEH